MEIQDRTDSEDAADPAKIGRIMGINPGLIRKADPEAAATIAGVYFYRQLDRKGQSEVMKGLSKLDETNPALGLALRNRFAEVIQQPKHWNAWSMSHQELDDGIKTRGTMIGWLEDIQKIVPIATGGAAGAIQRLSQPLAIGSAVTEGSLPALQKIAERQINIMKDELDRRPKKESNADAQKPAH